MKIALDIECGETTCASKPGKFCRFFADHIDDSKPQCRLFGDLLTDDKGDNTGCILRTKKCLEAGAAIVCN